MTGGLIWRFVDAEGAGVYRHADGGIDPKDVFSAIPYKHAWEYSQNRPTPYLDSFTLMASTEKGDNYGFATITQAKRWFNHPDDLKRWDKINVHLVAFKQSETKKYVAGAWQALFQPTKPHHYATLPASALYSMSAKALTAEATRQLAV